MKSFKQYNINILNEAYTIVPKNDLEIRNLIKTKAFEGKDVLFFIYDNFKRIYKEVWCDALPISADTKETNTVKIRRSYDLKKLVQPLKKKFPSFDIILNKTSLNIKRGREVLLKLEMGEGSRNNKAGGGAKGKSFEYDLASDIEKYKTDQRGVKYPEIMDSLYKILKDDYKIDLLKDEYEAVVDGGKNQKRKPTWSNSSGMTFNPSGDIGSIVTDLTVKSKNKIAFLSLKYTSNFYIVNSSIRPYLHENDPYSNIKERNDIAKYFGFNPKKFYTPYGIVSNEDVDPQESKVKKNWEHTLKGVIGHGYIYVVGGGTHDVVINSKKPPKIKVNNISEPLYALEGKRKYSKITIDVTIDNRHYVMDCQFRGTTASDILPYYMRVLVKK